MGIEPAKKNSYIIKLIYICQIDRFVRHKMWVGGGHGDIRARSSVGQSSRLIIDWSGVQVPPGPLLAHQCVV